MTPTDATFVSPDGHTWMRDADHQSTPRTPLITPAFEEGFRAGFADGFARVGAPLKGAELVHIHGWSYIRMVPAGAPDKPGAGTPPRLVLKLLTRLHPELRARERQARAALAGQVWLTDVEAWEAERPAWVRRCRDRVELDLAALDDGALAAEVEAAVGDAARMIRRHFELLSMGLGVGLALVDEGPAVMAALRSVDEPADSPTTLYARIAAELKAAGAGAPASLEEVRAASPRAAALLDELIAVHGWRVMNDDLAQPTLAERPQAILAAIAAADGSEPERREPVGPVSAAVESARRCAAALDDNSGVLTWAFGVVRRLVLEAGRRLTAAGRLHDADHTFVLDVEELGALLRGAGSPSAAEVAERYAAWRAEFAFDPPPVLGGPPAPPPDPSVFPPAMARVAAGLDAYIGNKFGAPAGLGAGDTGGAEDASGLVEVDGRVVARGVGVGGGSARGRAVVVASPDEALDRVEPGDVLVCPYTTPAYNAVFPLLSGVVCATGGALSHAAVTAREVGIVAVVGVGDCSSIPDGSAVQLSATPVSV